MKKLLVFLASAALLTSYAQTSSSGGSGGSGSSNSSRTSSGGTGNSGSSSGNRTSANARGQTSSGGSSTTSGTSTGTSSSTTRVNFDNLFLKRATADSLEEVILGGIAQTNSQNTDVQSFGALLVTNHTASIAQAQQLATTLGITLPTSLNTNQQREVQQLSGLTGVPFDQAFVASMITNHIRDIRLFEVAALVSTNADVRAYARDQLPILMNHLVTALQIRESLNGTQTTGATANTATTGTSGTTSTGSSGETSGSTASGTGGTSSSGTGGSANASGSAGGTGASASASTDP